MTTIWNAQAAAQILREAERTRTDRPPITADWPELDLATAYVVQQLVIDDKVTAGEKVIGVKLGLTSRAKQQRMGISSPLTGWVTDAMVLPLGELLQTGQLIHPRVEPEIVFVLGQPLAGPGVTAATALAAVASVGVGFEIIDSRFTDFKFALPDVVADNASAARLVLGAAQHDPAGLDLALEASVLQVNGHVVATATGAEVQGHPAEALALAANSLAQRGISLEPGWIVLTGGLTDAVSIKPGDQITAEFSRLGTVALGAT